MPKLYKRVSKKIGLPPGSLVHFGKQTEEKPRVSLTLVDYDQEKYEEIEIDDIGAIAQYKNSKTVSWININGIHDVPLIEKLGSIFNLNNLVLEDILSTNQRAKFEEYENYFYAVLKIVSFDKISEELKSEQLSIICGEQFVITFQEEKEDVFGYVRNRIKNSKGKIRKMGTNYLAYALLDSIVDHYFLVLEKIGDKLELLEEEISSSCSEKNLSQIHKYRRDVLYLRKVSAPIRELVHSFNKSELDFIVIDVEHYLRDLYDHTNSVLDTLDSFRDLLSNIFDIYMSAVSNKMNQVMKVLTIIATIFIPLTFIAGIYGMNFEFMPELKWKYGYFGVWTIMIICFAGMICYFKKKKWL
ncbi:MAG: magnesium/cobalt transporter CorA [Pseudomonadota bacterium]